MLERKECQTYTKVNGASSSGSILESNIISIYISL